MANLYGPTSLRYPNGRPAAGEEVEIQNMNGSIAVIYSDPLGTVTGNPITLDELGNLSFYANPGPYQIFVNGTPIPIEVRGSGGGDDGGLILHINDETPHPAYDDGPSFFLLYENAKV